MHIFKKIDKLNHLYSFNILAFNGFAILLTGLYLLYYYLSNEQNFGQGSWVTAMSWLMYIFGCVIFIIFIIAFIIWLLESVFIFKINNNYFVNNKIIKIARYIFATISLIYLIFNAIVLLDMFIIQPLLPDALTYYNIHTK